MDLVINPTSVNDGLKIGETSVWDIEISNTGPTYLTGRSTLCN